MNDVISLAREQRVRERAYQLWEEAGKPEGDADCDQHEAAVLA